MQETTISLLMQFLMSQQMRGIGQGGGGVRLKSTEFNHLQIQVYKPVLILMQLKKVSEYPPKRLDCLIKPVYGIN